MTLLARCNPGRVRSSHAYRPCSFSWLSSQRFQVIAKPLEFPARMMIAPSTRRSRKAMARGINHVIRPGVEVDVGDEGSRAALMALMAANDDFVELCG